MAEAISTVKAQKERLLDRINRMREEHKSGMRETVGAGITIGTAFAMGWWENRYPEQAEKGLMGAPIPLILGATLLGLAAFEVGGKEDSVYLGDAGRGALAAWAAVRGADIGRKQAEDAA